MSLSINTLDFQRKKDVLHMIMQICCAYCLLNSSKLNSHRTIVTTYLLQSMHLGTSWICMLEYKQIQSEISHSR